MRPFQKVAKFVNPTPLFRANMTIGIGALMSRDSAKSPVLSR